MAITPITETITQLDVVQEYSADYFINISQRNNALVNTVFPEQNTMASQMNVLADELNTICETIVEKEALIAPHYDAIDNAEANATSAQLSKWIAEAEAMTADSYASAPKDTFVKEYTSDGDGTFTATPTTKYSALHWAETINDANFVRKTGNETIAGIKTFSSTISGSINGNAATATKLATARTINGVPFDGTDNINVLPARLGSAAQLITDWNLAIENGWYMGDNTLNAPNTEWNLGIVEAHFSAWVTQTIHSFTTDSSSNSAVWRRQRNGDIWGDWYRLQLTQDEQDARYAKLTGDQTIAGIKTFSSFPITPSSAPTTDYQVANKKYVDDNAGISLGVGQTWQDVKSQRATNVTYINSTDKPIVVTVSLGLTGATYNYINGLLSYGYMNAGTGQYILIVPSGSTYKIHNTSASINVWLELR